MSEQWVAEHAADARTQTIAVNGVDIVYREIGAASRVPLVALNHLGANLDDWDPLVVDGLAKDRRIILLGYQGVGRAGGRARSSIEQMADDALLAVEALGLSRIELFGLSMGGMVAQEMVRRAPGLIERLILASSAPAGGPGLTAMTRVMIAGTAGAVVTFRNPKSLLFFTRSDAARMSARLYLQRLGERKSDRDSPVSAGALRAQLAAVNRWGKSAAARPMFDGPVLLVHGESDRMVPAANAIALKQNFPASSLTVYPDAGHGAVFQYHREFTAAVRAFLPR